MHARPGSIPAARRATAWMLTLLCLCLALNAQQVTPHSERADPRSKTRERVLHMVGGGVLRGDARWVADHWEVKRGKHWSALPAQAVERDALEQDLLDQARERLRSARRAGPDARAELAVWMAESGLLTESFEQMDEVLASAPDHTVILDLAARLEPSLALPSVPTFPEDMRTELEPLLAFGAGAPDSLRECLVLRLARVWDGEALREHLRAQVNQPDGGRRLFALLALRRLYPGWVDEDHARDLLNRSLMDGMADVRRSASLALRDTGEPGLAINLTEALESPSPVIRIHAAQALGSVGASSTLPALVNRLAAAASGSGWSGPRSTVFVGTQRAYVADFEPEIAQSATIANPEIAVIQEGATLDVRALGISGGGAYGPAREVAAINTALGNITGANPGRTAKAWKRWLEQRGK